MMDGGEKQISSGGIPELTVPSGKPQTHFAFDLPVSL